MVLPQRVQQRSHISAVGRGFTTPSRIPDNQRYDLLLHCSVDWPCCCSGLAQIIELSVDGKSSDRWDFCQVTKKAQQRQIPDGLKIHSRDNFASHKLRVFYFEVLGLWDPQQKVLVATRIPDRTGATMIPLIKYWCAPGLEIHTDAWSGYNSLPDEGFRHIVVVHK